MRRWRCNVGCLSSLRHFRQEAVFLALLLGDAPGLLLAEESRSCPLLARRHFHVCGALVLCTAAIAVSVTAHCTFVTACILSGHW